MKHEHIFPLPLMHSLLHCSIRIPLAAFPDYMARRMCVHIRPGDLQAPGRGLKIAEANV
jgi:hypothetical protein